MCGGGVENMVWIRGMFLLKIFTLNALLLLLSLLVILSKTVIFQKKKNTFVATFYKHKDI